MRLLVAVGLALAVGLATAVSPFASPSPDGLEKVAADQAFADRGRLHGAQGASPLAGYAVPGIGDARAATGLAGFAGTLFVFTAGLGVGRLARRPRRQRSARPWI